MKIELRLAAFIAWMSYISGGLIKDIGEQRPAYTVDWVLVLGFILGSSLLFYWGYSLGKESR